MIFLFLMTALPGFTACGVEDKWPVTSVPEIPEPQPDPDPEPGNSIRLRITLGNAAFAATLADNETARAFAALLPLTVTMNELNGNEKYHYLPAPLPAAASHPGTIRTGELMLYGSDCLVLFYKTFSTAYTYTRLGWLDNPAGLDTALGSGSVAVLFERTL